MEQNYKISAGDKTVRGTCKYDGVKIHEIFPISKIFNGDLFTCTTFRSRRRLTYKVSDEDFTSKTLLWSILRAISKFPVLVPLTSTDTGISKITIEP